MSTKPYIVLGEARESDTEEEIDSSVISNNEIEPCKGKIVSGEAPESDEESCEHRDSIESTSSAVSALSLPSPKFKKKSSKKYQSILIKKLCEKNASLEKNLNEFINQTATNAGNELNAANQRLLKCQVQMQEGTDYLKLLNSNLSILNSNLDSLLSTQYLPEITIPNSEEHKLESKPP